MGRRNGSRLITLFILALSGVVSAMPAKQQKAIHTISRDSFLLQEAQAAAVSAFTYRYDNYVQRMHETEKWFTQEGWQAFTDALRDSHNLEQVKDQEMIVEASLQSAAKFVKKNLTNRNHFWEIEVPLKVVYRGDQRMVKQYLVVNVTLIPVVDSLGGTGFGVTKFVARRSENV